MEAGTNAHESAHGNLWLIISVAYFFIDYAEKE